MTTTILTDEIIEQKLNDKGIYADITPESILEFIQYENKSKLNNQTSWAAGNETLQVYSQMTADNYEVYVCTEDERNINFENDVFYYIDGATFADRIIEQLAWGCDVWVDQYIYDEFEHDLFDALEDWYLDYYQEAFDDLKDELLSLGEYDEYK